MQWEPALVFQLSRKAKYVCIITSTYNSTLFKCVACHKLRAVFSHIFKTSTIFLTILLPRFLLPAEGPVRLQSSWTWSSLQAHTLPAFKHLSWNLSQYAFISLTWGKHTSNTTYNFFSLNCPDFLVDVLPPKNKNYHMPWDKSQV